MNPRLLSTITIAVSSPVPATFESRVLGPARCLRGLKAAPEGVGIEAIEPVERTTRALQAVALAPVGAQGEDRVSSSPKDRP